MTIREQWISFLKATATASRKTRTLLTPIGLVIFFAFTALFALSGMIADSLFDLPGLLPASLCLPFAVSLVTLGVVTITWSAFHFLKANGTPVPFNPPPKVVQTGPYRHTRNPMITGIFLILFGVGFGINSISITFVFAPLYVVINVWELKQIEEPELAGRLGDEYIEYREKTPMFIPGCKSRNTKCL